MPLYLNGILHQLTKGVIVIKNKKTINSAESILLVSSFFMYLYIYKEMTLIDEFEDLFDTATLLFIFPVILLILSLYSFFTRD